MALVRIFTQKMAVVILQTKPILESTWPGVDQN